jgi:hypothetical protein
MHDVGIGFLFIHIYFRSIHSFIYFFILLYLIINLSHLYIFIHLFIALFPIACIFSPSCNRDFRADS